MTPYCYDDRHYITNTPPPFPHASLCGECMAYDAHTKERDAALVACGEMRELLRRALPSVQFAALLPLADEINKALASTAGRGWVSPEEHAKVVATVQEASVRIHGALTWGFDPNTAVSGLVRAVDALVEDRNAARREITNLFIGNGWVSPEAFDAALRKVALQMANADLYGADVDEKLVNDIIAAAKAKHGGGK